MLEMFPFVAQLIVILAVCRGAGHLFETMHQPRVVGELFGGIALGPSLLGWVAPRWSAHLFPPSTFGPLHSLSQVGVIVFMFLVGLNINPGELRKRREVAVLTSHVSMTAPFVLASCLALYLYPRLSDDSVSFYSFALFMGAAMSITAFPVLARILSERSMLQSHLGTIAITVAAVDDVTGWCVLAFVLVVSRGVHSSNPMWIALSGLLFYSLFMIYGVRRLLRHFATIYEERSSLSENEIAIIVLLVLCSALCTEFIGIHLLFGSFMMGVLMPKSPQLTSYITDRLETVTVTLLLPLFFAYTGLRTNCAVVIAPHMWVYFTLITLVATLGKCGGSMLAAFIGGMSLREAAALGVLMNTRGLMELVILNVGLDAKIVSPALFSLMVMMALATTFMTTPILEWVYPKRMSRPEPSAFNGAALG